MTDHVAATFQLQRTVTRYWPSSGGRCRAEPSFTPMRRASATITWACILPNSPPLLSRSRVPGFTPQSGDRPLASVLTPGRKQILQRRSLLLQDLRRSKIPSDPVISESYHGLADAEPFQGTQTCTRRRNGGAPL